MPFYRTYRVGQFYWWKKYDCLVKTTQTCWMSLTNFTTLRCKEYPEKNTVWRTCQKSLTNVTTYSSIEYVFPSYNRGLEENYLGEKVFIIPIVLMTLKWEHGFILLNRNKIQCVLQESYVDDWLHKITIPVIFPW